MTLSSNRHKLESLLQREGFEQFGVAELARPLTIELYEEWLNKGYQGEMSYLVRHLPEKKDPQKLLPRAKTAIVVTKNYVPHPEPQPQRPLKGGVKVASYARGRDYHHFLKARLSRVIESLKEDFPNEAFLAFTDSSPVLERDLASRAGLGWIGKNTCLLSRSQGSLFFIAEIYTTLEFPVAKLEVHDHCGTCTRCLDACPTGALKAPRELDARLCISYLTIEAKSAAPEGLREKIGDWFFGCDICQTVCPWNIKVHGAQQIDQLQNPFSTPEDEHRALCEDLRYILSSSIRGLEKDFAGTPLFRSGGRGLKRNALVVAGNRKLSELRTEMEALSTDEHLGSLAKWALSQNGF